MKASRLDENTPGPVAGRDRSAYEKSGDVSLESIRIVPRRPIGTSQRNTSVL